MKKLKTILISLLFIGGCTQPVPTSVVLPDSPINFQPISDEGGKPSPEMALAASIVPIDPYWATAHAFCGYDITDSLTGAVSCDSLLIFILKDTIGVRHFIEWTDVTTGLVTSKWFGSSTLVPFIPHHTIKERFRYTTVTHDTTAFSPYYGGTTSDCVNNPTPPPLSNISATTLVPGYYAQIAYNSTASGTVQMDMNMGAMVIPTILLPTNQSANRIPIVTRSIPKGKYNAQLKFGNHYQNTTLTVQ